MKIKPTLLFIFLLTNALPCFCGTDWELAKDEEEIRVYTREVDGWDTEEFKVIAYINVKRYLIYNALIDIASYPGWYPDIVESGICKKVSETDFYCYSKLDLPWPTDDRMGESHMKVTHNSETKVTLIDIKASSQCNVEHSGYIKMTKGQGFWKLTSKGEGTVVHYQYLSDPGGSIPAWVINMFIVDNPFNTVKALKEKVGG